MTRIANRLTDSVTDLNLANRESPQSKPESESWRRFLALTILFTILIFLRCPGGFLYPTLYFEDGTTFYQNQLLSQSALTAVTPFEHGVFRQYYFLLIPRFTAYLAYLLPAQLAPYIFNGIGIITFAICGAAFTLNRFRFMIWNDFLRIVVGALFVLSLDNTEWMGTASNSFWPMTVLLILLAAKPPEYRACSAVIRSLLQFASGALIALSTTLSVLAAPLSAWKLLRDRATRFFSLGVIFGIACQITVASGFFLGFSGEQVNRPAFEWLSFRNSFFVTTAYRVVMPSLLGHRSTKVFYESGLSGTHYVPLLLFGCLALILLCSRNHTKVVSTCVALYLFLSTLFLALYGRDLWVFLADFQKLTLWGGSRYFYPACCCFAFMFANCLDLLGTKVRQPVVALGMFAAFLPGIIDNFDLRDHEHDVTLSWTDHAQQINRWNANIVSGQPTGALRLPIYFPPVWSITLPENFIPTPSFEESVDAGWSSSEFVAFKQSTDFALTGSKSLEISGKYGKLSRTLYIARGQSPTISVSTRLDCSNAHKPPKLSFYVEDGSSKRIPSKNRPACGKWERLSVTLPAQSSGRAVTLYFRWVGKGGRAFVDDIGLG